MFVKNNLLGCCKAIGLSCFYGIKNDGTDVIEEIETIVKDQSNAPFMACILNHGQKERYHETLINNGFEVASIAKERGYETITGFDENGNYIYKYPDIYFYIRTVSREHID